MFQLLKKFPILNVLSLSHVIKAQCHWVKDIEHFGTDKLRGFWDITEKELFISSGLTPFSLTVNCVKIEPIVTMKIINRTNFFF